MIRPSIVHFGDVNMTSAVMKGDFHGFLRTVCGEPVDSQKQWCRRQFMDTVASPTGLKTESRIPTSKIWNRVPQWEDKAGLMEGRSYPSSGRST
jgi:hypothetical protein